MDKPQKGNPALYIGAAVVVLFLLRGCGGADQTSASLEPGGDGSYINRTESGITVGGNGRDFYVNDRSSGSSLSNDGN